MFAERVLQLLEGIPHAVRICNIDRKTDKPLKVIQQFDASDVVFVINTIFMPEQANVINMLDQMPLLDARFAMYIRKIQNYSLSHFRTENKIVAIKDADNRNLMTELTLVHNLY